MGFNVVSRCNTFDPPAEHVLSSLCAYLSRLCRPCSHVQVAKCTVQVYEVMWQICVLPLPDYLANFDARKGSNVCDAWSRAASARLRVSGFQTGNSYNGYRGSKA